MAAPEETIESISETSALTDSEYEEDYEETPSPSFCCGCFKGLYFGHKYRKAYLLHQQEETRQESWLVTKTKKMREISEVLAGPRWKNFIRSFSSNGVSKKRRMQFQYDPKSHALNFDDGIEREVEFMARFAGSVGSNRVVKLERDLIDL
ncbi:hypothetical protein HS088_TW04G00099 [Tripterygium wilfordii]|uniref:Uncharacterized protein n=1 Tax=Tripterygium wilfordii TaxID=458696 RepID=A0A7J7DPE1_TRIWF|nr:hypothetical protein HS088_TW04G00099 [Tripterygium wilfordii]